MASDPDLALLERWRAGDATAGEQLFERHFDSVYGFFCNKVGRDVDDLVQETFLGCVHSKERFRAESTFRTFLFAVAHRQLMKYRERWYKTRDRRADFELSRVEDLDMTPSQLVIENAEQELLLRALRRLPLELQVILELFYWQNIKSADIAVILDIPHGTARSRLRRAREQLRANVERLAKNPALLRSTIGDFDGWLRSLQQRKRVDDEGQAQDPSHTD